MIVSDRDDSILKNIKRKQADADKMSEGMVKAMSKYTIGQLGSVGAERMTGWRTCRRNLWKGRNVWRQ